MSAQHVRMAIAFMPMALILLGVLALLLCDHSGRVQAIVASTGTAVFGCFFWGGMFITGKHDEAIVGAFTFGAICIPVILAAVVVELIARGRRRA